MFGQLKQRWKRKPSFNQRRCDRFPTSPCCPQPPYEQLAEAESMSSFMGNTTGPILCQILHFCHFLSVDACPGPRFFTCQVIFRRKNHVQPWRRKPNIIGPPVSNAVSWQSLSPPHWLPTKICGHERHGLSILLIASCLRKVVDKTWEQNCFICIWFWSGQSKFLLLFASRGTRSTLLIALRWPFVINVFCDGFAKAKQWGTDVSCHLWSTLRKRHLPYMCVC